MPPRRSARAKKPAEKKQDEWDSDQEEEEEEQDGYDSEDGDDVPSCLSAIGVDLAALKGCANLAEEFTSVKKSYSAAVLKAHPDKGGDAATFRKVRTAFETLRRLFQDGKIPKGSFVPGGKDGRAPAKGGKAAKGAPKKTKRQKTAASTTTEFVPPWDFYAEAAADAVPSYRVEFAKSGRSKCAKKNCPDSAIEKNAVRVGSMDPTSGTYGRWNHIACWRVPSKVWLGLPDPKEGREAVEAALLKMNEVIFEGLSELDEDGRRAVVDHVMNKGNWAELRKPKGGYAAAAARAVSEVDEVKPAPAGQAAAPAGSSAAAPAPARQEGRIVEAKSASREVVVASQGFIVPVPGRNGAPVNALAGKTVVLTGVFPEVGGGTGLNLGKAKLKAVIESFGGKCTGSISGKTDFLIVGKSPGFSKVSQARSRDTVGLLTTHQLKDRLENGGNLAIESGDSAPLVISSFSGGYGGNGLAKSASPEKLAHASGADQLARAKPGKRALLLDDDPPSKKHHRG